MFDDPGTCKYCYKSTRAKATSICNACYKLEIAIRNNPVAAQKIFEINKGLIDFEAKAIKDTFPSNQ